MFRFIYMYILCMRAIVIYVSYFYEDIVADYFFIICFSFSFFHSI